VAKVNYTKLKKEDKLVLRDKNNQEVKNVIFPNGIQVGIEGNEHFNDSTLILPSSGVPSNTSNRLYNENGVLKFGGVAITTGSQSGGWTDDGSAVHLTTSTDYVGIGTTSPQYKLHIEESDETAYLFLSRNDSAISNGEYLGGVIFGGTENGSSWAPSAYITAQATEDWTETSDEGTRLTFWTTPDTTAAVSAAMIINSNGNVSIGSSVSSYKLDVTNGDARIFGDDGYNGTGDKAKLYLGDGNSGAYAEWGEGLVFSVYKSSGDGGLVDGSGNSTDAAFVKQVTGYVGIGSGSATPLSQLYVSDGGDPLLDVNSADEYHLMLRSPDNLNDAGVGIAFARSTNAAMMGSSIVFKRTGANSMGELLFYTKQSTAASAPTLALTIGANGNIGMGTGSLGEYRLDVSDGDARIKGDDGWNGSGDKGKLYLGDSLNGVYAEYGQGLVFGVYKSSGNGGLVDGSGDSTDAMYIAESTGRIGIGKSDPEGFVNIKNTSISALDDVGTTTNYHLHIQCDTANDTAAGIAFGSTDGNVGSAIIYKDVGNYAQGELQFYTKASGVDGDDPVLAMVIDKDGNVGVGTATPDYDFEVEKDGAEIFAHYAGQSRGGFKALSSQRLSIMTTAIADDIVFGYSSDTDPADDGSDFVQRMKIDNGTGDVTVESGDLLIPNVQSSNTTECRINTSSGQIYYYSSTRKIKNNIQDSDVGLNEILSMQPVTYELKSNPGEIILGLIAEDSHDVSSFFSMLGPDFDYDEYGQAKIEETVDDKGAARKAKVVLSEDKVPIDWNSRSVIAALINSIKTLKVQNDALSARITLLEANEH